MRIVDAEPELIRDFTEEVEVIASKAFPDFKVVAGRHATLGRVVIIEDAAGKGVIVEAE